MLTTAVLLAGPGWAQESALSGVVNAPTKLATICETIDQGAAEYGLPVDFFTRLIWKESRLEPKAVSPVGAQGIAQFMPQTAAYRGLADPFDPAQAIPASAHYLSDLEDSLGNLGLAAAAYNAGEGRVSSWLAGTTASLPAETQDYVRFITGHTVDEWKSGAASAPAKSMDCADVTASLALPQAGAALIPQTPPHAPPAKATPAPAPWGVQLAGNFSEAKARASYTAMQKQYASIIGQRDPVVVRTVVRSRGTAPFFNLRVPAATRAEADALCAKLHAAGGACTVMKSTA